MTVAEQPHYEFAEVKTQDILANRQAGWEGFTHFLVWCIGGTVLILILMAVFLV